MWRPAESRGKELATISETSRKMDLFIIVADDIVGRVWINNKFLSILV